MYASLQPFNGWRSPSQEVLDFLHAPWPRYMQYGDIVINVLAYLPLGVLLYAALRSKARRLAACAGAIILSSALSLAMEHAQMFLPTRIASNVDLIANSAGAAIGALAAWIISLPILARPLSRIRRDRFRPGVLGDCGLIAVALWLLAQFDTAPFALSGGDLRETLEITPLFVHTPQSYLLAEAASAACSLLAISLIATLLIRPPRSALPTLLALTVITVIIKSIAALTLARLTNPLQWLTPGTALGFAIAAALLGLSVRLVPMVRGLFALLCVIACVIIVNITPENPYQAAPPFAWDTQPTHLFNFSVIIHTLAQSWPALAAMLLAAMIWASRSGGSQA